jgi:hypothetical protein
MALTDQNESPALLSMVPIQVLSVALRFRILPTPERKFSKKTICGKPSTRQQKTKDCCTRIYEITGKSTFADLKTAGESLDQSKPS